MTTVSLILKCKDHFPEDSWGWVIPALRQDMVIWKNLNNPEFWGLARNRLENQPQNWSPANLALLALDFDRQILTYPAAKLETELPELCQAAARTFKEHATEHAKPLSLAQIGQLAIYLVCNPDQIETISNPSVLAVWVGFKSELLLEELQVSPPAFGHAILCQPLPPHALEERCKEILSKLPLHEQVALLEYLRTQRPELAQKLTREWSPSKGNFKHNDYAQADSDLPSQISEKINIANLRDLTREPELSLQAAAAAWEAAQVLQKHLATRVICQKISIGAVQDLSQDLGLLLADESQLAADEIASVILALAEHAETELPAWFSEGIPPNLVSGSAVQHCLARGYLHLTHNNSPKAVTQAMAALEDLQQSPPAEKSYFMLCAQLFNRLDDLPTAIQALELGLGVYPNQIDLLERLLNYQHHGSEHQGAINTGHLITVLAPKRLDLHRKFAEIISITQDWVTAWKQREHILTLAENLPDTDFTAAAESALYAEQHPRAVEICQDLLTRDPQSVASHRIIGLAFLELGEPHQARTHLTQTLEMAPTQVESWLALAKLYNRVNERDQVLKTLQSAINAVPTHPEVHLALGEYHLSEQALTQALESFRQADLLAKTADAVIKPEIKARIAERFGSTLLKLGHDQAAHKNLAKAVKELGTYPGLFHAFGKVLTAVDKPQESLNYLNQAAVLDPNNPEIKIDIAAAHLATCSDLDTSREILIDILDKTENQGIVLALLAETHEYLNEPELALERYRLAINSGLQAQPEWYIRLSLGIGRVALTLDQNEIALATLKQAASRHPKNIAVLQALSTAFLKSNLEKQAWQTAQAALNEDPTNSNLLDWFIEGALGQQAYAVAISAVENVLAQTPNRPNLVAKLGWLHVSADDVPAAQEVFQRVKEFDHVAPTDLYSISQGFRALGDNKNARLCIEKAITISESTGEDQLLPKLYSRLTQILAESGNTEAALETIDRAIAAAPQDTKLIGRKGNLLVNSGQIEVARNWIESALDQFESEPALHLQAAIIHSAAGDLNTAIFHAQEAQNIVGQHQWEPQALAITGQVADVAAAGLQFKLAEDILDQGYPRLQNQTPGSEKAFDFHCLRAEIALEQKEEIGAAKAATMALEIDPENPRAIALQAQLTARQGDIATAKTKLVTALENIGLRESATSEETHSNPAWLELSTAALLGISAATIHFHLWAITAELLQRAIQTNPGEPRAQLHLARFLTLRAEAHQLAQFLNISTHSTGDQVISESAYQEFEIAILAAQNSLPMPDLTENLDPKDLIDNWLTRGQAVFQPSEEHAAALEKYAVADEACAAAHIGAWRRGGKRAVATRIATETYQKIGDRVTNPILLAQIAIALVKSNPIIARQAAQTAVELGTWHNLPTLPIFYALQALVAHRNGDFDLQVKALGAALNIWPDEANWLVELATTLQSNFDDLDTRNLAQDCLEKAVRLEPHQYNHYIRLSEFHQAKEEFDAAIQVLEKGTGVLPENPHLWLALTRLHQIRQDVPQIIRCATRVSQLDPGNTPAQLILAETALAVENPEKALEYAQSALKTEPNNAQAHTLQAKAFSNLDQPANALAALERAITETNANLSLELERITLIEKTQGLEAALAALQQLVLQEPENPQVMTTLAKLQAQKGDHHTAIQTAQQALNQSQVADRTDLLSDNLILLGRLLRKSGQLDAAINYLSQMIELQPENAEAFLELGRSYFEQRKPERALEKLEKAITMQPDDPQPYFYAGLALKEKQAFAEAQRMLRRAADLAPHNLTIHRQLGTTTVFNIVHNQKTQV